MDKFCSAATKVILIILVLFVFCVLPYLIGASAMLPILTTWATGFKLMLLFVLVELILLILISAISLS
jgi:hypothetical protein